MSINTFIPLPIHFLEIAGGECNCSFEIRQKVWAWGVKAMNDAWKAEEELLIGTGEAQG